MGGNVGFGAKVFTIFLCHVDFDKISSGYRSKINFSCLTLSVLSGIIISATTFLLMADNFDNSNLIFTKEGFETLCDGDGQEDPRPPPKRGVSVHE